MQDHAADSIRRWVFHFAWIDEAQSLSARSLRIIATDHPPRKLRAVGFVEYPWAFSDTLYWRKTIRPDPSPHGTHSKRL
jgi:hypothetical protein